MDVHHHSHTPRKTWTHYFWEFLMLFLAVFCGFMAENQREHMIEHQREKKYMRTLVEDLAADTMDLRRAMSKADTVIRFSDSAVIYMREHRPDSFIPFYFASFIGYGGQRQLLNLADRTSSQLKNAGAMRLIRNDAVSDMILKYWSLSNNSMISLDRYMLYRDASRALAFKMWVVPEVYMAGGGNVKDSITLRVIDQDPKKWDELANLMAMMNSITLNVHAGNLQRQLNTARELMALIKEEYHLK
ncbi:MAG TPA: hypothetical protein VMZ03_05475 [Chitinophagaceae bacterium]|nr:hypothetical protein [Chitinophagaceae bacterium]